MVISQRKLLSVLVLKAVFLECIMEADSTDRNRVLVTSEVIMVRVFC